MAVVLDGSVQPAWIARVLEHVRSSAHTQLVRVDFVPREPREEGWLERLDRRKFGRDDDALAPRDIHALIEHERDDGPLDVVLAFGETKLEARFGVWTVEHDDTTANLRLQGGGTLRSARGATDAISRRRGLGRLLWKCAALIEQQLALVHRDGTIATTEGRPIEKLVRRSAFDTAKHYVAQQVRDRLTREQWLVAFSFGGREYRDFHRIVPPDDRFWADPFVIAEGDRAWIFVEELVYREGRGVLAVLEARRDGTWSQPRRILERPYHLSYPCVFRWNGGYWMLPETHENRTLELYRAVEFPYRWEPDTVLMRDIAAVDATIFEAHGRWWLYVTTAVAKNAWDELSLYHADSPRGPWIAHRRNPLLSDVAGGRSAGRPFIRDGKLVRAVQHGAKRYAHAMVLREIVALTPDEWAEREVGKIDPDWMPGLAGTHTLNADGEVTVIDGHRDRWSLFRK